MKPLKVKESFESVRIFHIYGGLPAFSGCIFTRKHTPMQANTALVTSLFSKIRLMCILIPNKNWYPFTHL
jgi:hypothetical protein